MLGNALLLALRQIFRNPMRSILTVLGIVIGVAAVITMVTVGNGATQQVRDQIASLGSDSLMIRPGQRLGPGQSVGAPSFKESDAEALATQIAGIKAVAPSRTSTQVVVANGKNWSTSVIGTTNDYFSINNLTIQEGRNFEQSELGPEVRSVSSDRRLKKSSLKTTMLWANCYASKASPAKSSASLNKKASPAWEWTKTMLSLFL